MLVQRSKLLSADRNLTDDDRKIVDKKLRSMGIDVRTGVGLEEVTPDSVRLASEGQSETVATETVIWTGGVRAPGFLKAWGVPLTDSGRIAVDAHLRVKGLSHVYAIGDAAAAPAGGDQEAPMTAQEAGVQGRLVAANLKKLQKGRPLTAYKPKNLGVAISLGRRDGLLRTLGLRIKGRPAALLKQVIEKRHERSLRRNGFRRGVRRAVDALTQKARGRVAPRPRLRTAR